MRHPIVGPGLCYCGCGERTAVAKKTQAACGRFKGQPNRFMNGHGATNGPIAFWSQVSQSSDCWLWTGYTYRGYGMFGPRRVHRLMFETHAGAISDGFEVCHTCDTPPCVNPAHLFLGTHQDNMTDMAQKGRRIEKLSFEDVRQIRALRADGLKLQELADMFDVSISMVSRIALRKGRTEEA